MNYYEKYILIDPQYKTVLKGVAWVVSGVVFLLVVLMRRYKIETEIDFTFLASFHAGVNVLTAAVLIYSWHMILKRNVDAHQRSIFLAMILSVIFLLSYVTYHFTTEETLYCGQGAIRILYFFLLITHIVLAAVILPFTLFTFIRAITGDFQKHVKMARWVMPLWLYVAASGPIVYLMLFPCFR